MKYEAEYKAAGAGAAEIYRARARAGSIEAHEAQIEGIEAQDTKEAKVTEGRWKKRLRTEGVTDGGRRITTAAHY